MVLEKEKSKVCARGSDGRAVRMHGKAPQGAKTDWNPQVADHFPQKSH